MMSLAELHSRLRLQIKELHDERDGRPVYLIEHGLAPAELEAATFEVREALHGAELGSAEWGARYMPLLVIATEVGYEFGSTGHEYWPVLEERLGWEFTEERRHALRDLFRAVRSHTGVEPPETEWALNYHLIAWPIAHAVLPKRLHERLLRVILKVTKPIAKAGDYYEQLREFAASELPLANFLAQEELARSILEGIIADEPTPLLSKPLIERLRTDVLDAPVHRSLARQVKERQAAMRPARRQGGAAARSAARLLPITLYIDQVALEARVPALRIPALELPDVERARVRVLGMGRHYTVSALASDGCALPSLAPPEEQNGIKALIAEDDLPSNRQAAAQLRGLCVDLKRPLVFAETSTGELAIQLRSGTYPEGAKLWVVPPKTAPAPTRTEARRVLSDEIIYRCDARAAEAWLASLGLRKARALRTRLLGSPSLSQPLLAGGVLVRGDQVFLKVDGAAQIVRIGSSEVAVEDGVYALEATDGESALDIAFGDGGAARAQDLRMDFVEVRPQRRPLVEAHLEGPPTVGALRAGRVSIRITSEAPIAGVRVCLRAREFGRDTNAIRLFTEPLPALPTVIDGAHPIWERLTQELSGTRTCVLEADVGGLGGERWMLDAEDRLHSRDDEDGVGSAVGSEEACWFDAAKPWEIASGASGADLWLVQPLRTRASSDGPAPILGAGVVGRGRRPHVLGSRAVITPPKRLLRRLESDGSSIGALQIVTAWLCWATASALDALAAGGRREVAAALDAWTGAALCGPLWSELEAAARPGLAASFGRHLADALWSTGVCTDGQVEEALDGPELDAAKREMARQFGVIEGWVRRATQQDELHEQLAEALDNIAIEAYRHAALEAGRSDLDPDVGSAADEVASIARDAIAGFDEIRTGATLLSLMHPHSAGARLADIEYATAPEGDLLEQLTRTIEGRPEGLPWTWASTEALLNAWVHPNRARPQALPDVLERALEDRGAARMIRYCALRRRAALGLVP